MNPIKKSKAVINAAKTITARKLARKAANKKPMDLTPIKEMGVNAIKGWAKNVPSRMAKTVRNTALGLDKNAGRAFDDTYDLIKNGKQKITRREFLHKAKDRAIKYNTERVNAIVPEPVKKKVGQIVEEAQRNKYNYSYRSRLARFSYFEPPSRL